MKQHKCCISFPQNHILWFCSRVHCGMSSPVVFASIIMNDICVFSLREEVSGFSLSLSYINALWTTYIFNGVEKVCGSSIYKNFNTMKHNPRVLDKPRNTKCIKTVCGFTKKQCRHALRLSSFSGATTPVLNTSMTGCLLKVGKNILQHKEGQILPVWIPVQTTAPTSATSHVRGKLIQKLVPGL